MKQLMPNTVQELEEYWKVSGKAPLELPQKEPSYIHFGALTLACAGFLICCACAVSRILEKLN